MASWPETEIPTKEKEECKHEFVFCICVAMDASVLQLFHTGMGYKTPSAKTKHNQNWIKLHTESDVTLMASSQNLSATRMATSSLKACCSRAAVLVSLSVPTDVFLLCQLS